VSALTADDIGTVTALRARLWDAGFRPVPVFNADADVASPGKQPLGKAWQIDARRNPPFCANSPAVAHAMNSGILCDGLRPIDFDIDDGALARQCCAIAVDMFGEAPIRTRQGSPRCLMLYRAAVGEPSKIVLPGRLGKIEILGRGQQFVAFGMHPSGVELEWFPDPPGSEPRDTLPAVTEEGIVDFLTACAPIIDAPPPIKGNGHDHAGSEPQADPLRIAAALDSIPNSGPPDWELWNRVGMAGWRATGGSSAGWEAWNAWSARNTAYDPDATRARWDHYAKSPPTSIGAGTIFRMAAKARNVPPPEADTREEQPHDDAGDNADAETLPFAMFGDIKPALDSNDFVEGLLASSSLVVIYGEPGSGKTFWVLDICLHVADGRQWRDRAVEQGAVMYLALEGGAGIRNRIAAARSRLALPDATPLALVQSPVDLCHSDADVAKVIATIKLIGKRLGMPVRIVVVDTLARAMAGGNENAPEDMGTLVAHSDRIRDQTGACVFYIHHCGKDAARGSRGHSSLKAATDTEIEVTRSADRGSIARVTRQRDMESEGSFAFRLESVELGRNQRGKPVTSCVVTPADGQAEPAGAVALTDNERIALRCLDQAMKADAILATVFDDHTEGLVVRADDWRAWFYREGKPGSDRKAKEKAFKRALDGLLAKGRIGTRDDLIWPTSRRS
jgi:hypothetical protein